MKVLMFGWEFPPVSSGGLGTACYGLTSGLSKKGVEITFVVPYWDQETPTKSHVKIVVADNVKVIKISSDMQPYISSDDYLVRKPQKNRIYGATLFQEVYRYAQKAMEIARNEEFDVIHCHDWMTFEAGINARKVSKKPLILQIHATEFDRTGNQNANPFVYDIEREGMHTADKIITVSNYTKNIVVEKYGINPEKVCVVHNAVIKKPGKFYSLKKHSKIVLFLGRITIQKGPDYFVYTAKRVLEKEPDTIFILAGSGDMEAHIIEKAAAMGIADKVLFSGFLRGEDVDRAYQMADVYVMPSVSEPFGITALEAMQNRAPVIVSKNAGVLEVVNNCLKVDFWDIDEMANKIIALLRYPALHQELREQALHDLDKVSWDNSADDCLNVYKDVLGRN